MSAKRKILVADDSPLFRDLESLFLARAGEVITAADGEQALRLAREERPAVAVLDLHMPILTGDQVCRALRSEPELEDMPVVIVTGGVMAEDRERAVRAGADDVIAKPVHRIILLQAVGRLLRNRRMGLTRVPLETEVRMRLDCGQAFGTSRNLSRGGMFVQVAEPLPHATELEASFTLPDSKLEIRPSAVVVWGRPRAPGQPPGMGLQFLRLDRESCDRIDAYVYQNASPAPAQG